MKILKCLNQHKTKLAGIAVAILGYLQTQEELLRVLFTETQFAWITLSIGVLVIICGCINSSKYAPHVRPK